MSPVRFRRRGDDVREVLYEPERPALRIGSLGATTCARCNGTGADPEGPAVPTDDSGPVDGRPECSACHGDGFIDDPTEAP
jgi:hypothetical protein